MMKLILLSVLIILTFDLSAQTDHRLYDYVKTSIEQTREKFFERDSLLNPQYRRPDISKFEPWVTVNKKSVEMDFLKHISISDTLSVIDRADKLFYISSGPARRLINNGMIAITIDKRVFRELKKTRKSDSLSKREN
ncbi:MAG: hypothetical protein RIM99_07595 [Cyclobacteriaceae bacterium]